MRVEAKYEMWRMSMWYPDPPMLILATHEDAGRTSQRERPESVQSLNVLSRPESCVIAGVYP